ncbi:MAG: DUF5690 family protein [Kofleriaceae bacterium]
MRITRWLERASPALFSTYAVVMAFTTYFAMYSFRKPFSVAHYAGGAIAGIDLKSAFIISQVAGYATSKFAGIKFNSEMKSQQRAWVLVALIVWAEASLVLFAVLPPEGKLIALFCNGLPLGTVWGVVFSFLEGRRTSEILGAGLSCAYVVASGAVKSVGSALLGAGVPEAWMPALTGLLFLPVFLAAVYFLSLIPPPSAADVAARTEREPMNKAERRAFIRRFWPGLVALIFTYLALTSYRDFRDSFVAEIWEDLGRGKDTSIFTYTEIPIAVTVMAVLAFLYRVQNNRRALALTYWIMGIGAVLVGVATLLFDAGVLPATPWIILVGLGLYLGYVPYGCVLFDRTIASLEIVATAVFLIYISDAIAYPGTVAVVLYKTLGQAGVSKLVFFRYFSYATSIVCIIGFSVAGPYFLRRKTV